MKKFNVTLLALLISLTGMSQYQKAGYFGKDGRFYGLGTRFHMLGGENSTVMGYTLTLGRDTDGKQMFNNYELELIPSYTVTLMTADGNGDYVPTTVTTKTQFTYAIGVGYFLLKNENDQRKVKPYLSAAIGVKLFGGIKEEESAYSDDIAGDMPFSVNLNGGGGLFYYFTPKFGLQAEGGYSYQTSLSGDGMKGKNFALPKHPYVKAGLIFRIVGN